MCPYFHRLQVGFFRPYRSLDFAYVGFVEKEHTESGLPDTTANSLRKITIKKSLMPIEIFSLFAASDLKLSKECFSIDSDTHT